MVLTSILIGVAFFAALLALLGSSYSDRTSHEDEAPLDHVHLDVAGEGECLLCHGRLPRLGTADDAVSAIERRIAADRTEVAAGLAGGVAQAVAERER